MIDNQVTPQLQRLHSLLSLPEITVERVVGTGKVQVLRPALVMQDQEAVQTAGGLQISPRAEAAHLLSNMLELSRLADHVLLLVPSRCVRVVAMTEMPCRPSYDPEHRQPQDLSIERHRLR